MDTIFVIPSEAEKVILRLAPSVSLAAILPAKERKIVSYFKGTNKLAIKTPRLAWIQQYYPDDRETGECRLYAISSDDTKLADYKLANVHGGGAICWGDNNIPRNLKAANNLYWSAPMNADLWPVYQNHMDGCCENGVLHSHDCEGDGYGHECEICQLGGYHGHTCRRMTRGQRCTVEKHNTRQFFHPEIDRLYKIAIKNLEALDYLDTSLDTWDEANLVERSSLRRYLGFHHFEAASGPRDGDEFKAMQRLQSVLRLHAAYGCLCPCCTYSCECKPACACCADSCDCDTGEASSKCDCYQGNCECITTCRCCDGECECNTDCGCDLGEMFKEHLSGYKPDIHSFVDGKSKLLGDKNISHVGACDVVLVFPGSGKDELVEKIGEESHAVVFAKRNADGSYVSIYSGNTYTREDGKARCISATRS